MLLQTSNLLILGLFLIFSWPVLVSFCPPQISADFFFHHRSLTSRFDMLRIPRFSSSERICKGLILNLSFLRANCSFQVTIQNDSCLHLLYCRLSGTRMPSDNNCTWQMRLEKEIEGGQPLTDLTKQLNWNYQSEPTILYPLFLNSTFPALSILPHVASRIYLFSISFAVSHAHLHMHN